MSGETYSFSEIFVVSGVFSAFISALIAWGMQRYFFNQQDKRDKERARDADKKKNEFVLKAFLQESKFNLDLIKIIDWEKTTTKILFDTHCYSIFKSDIGILEEEIVKRINEVYLELFSNNQKIDAEFRQGSLTQTSSVIEMYRKLENPLTDFIKLVEEKLKIIERAQGISN